MKECREKARIGHGKFAAYAGTFLVGATTERSILLDPETLEQLRNQDWETIYPALVRYAQSRVSRLSWNTKDGDPPSGLDASDIAREAISKVFSGDRNWDCRTEPDLLRFLWSIVNSLTSHLVESADHVHRFTPLPDDEDQDPLSRSTEAGSLTPFDLLLYRDLLDYLNKAAKGDPVLEGVVLCLALGIDKPQDMADELEVDIQEIYNARKRLRRVADNYRDEQQK